MSLCSRNIFKLKMTENNSLKIIEIINNMRLNKCPTHEEIELLLKNRRESIFLLSEVLKEVIHWKTIPEERSDAPIHAVFLFGALESKEGLGLLYKILSKDGDFIHGFLGDILTECLPWALARMAKDKPKRLYKIAKRNSTYSYARSAAVRACVEQCFLYPERRRIFVKYFRKLLEKVENSPDPNWPSMLVDNIADMAPYELRKEITDLFDKDLIALGRINREDMERAYKEPDFYYLTVDDDIFSIYDDYGWMIAWNDPVIGIRKRRATEEEKTQFDVEPIRKGHKIGRNESCPCGSGKKYKKCCGK